MTTDLAPHPWLAPDPVRGKAVRDSARAVRSALIRRGYDPEPALLREACRTGCSTCLAILDRRETIGVAR